MRNRFEKHKKRSTGKALLIPVFLCIFMAAMLWNGSSRIFQETKERQIDGIRGAVLRGAVHCYAVEGRYPGTLTYLEDHYGVTYDKKKFLVSYEIIGSNRMPSVTVIALNER